MNFLNKKAYKEILNFVESNFEKIEVVPGECRYNFRCQMNAVHEALKNNDSFVVMCFYINKTERYPSVHFVNIKDGRYIDNSIGNWSNQFDYYLVKKVLKEDFFKIDEIMMNYKKYLRTQLSFASRVFSDITC